MDFVNRIKQYIGANGLLESGSAVVVGVSGGADSTALLKVLIGLGYRCIAVHCNFHLRGEESERDQQFVTELCQNLGVELIVCSYDTVSYARQRNFMSSRRSPRIRITLSALPRATIRPATSR